MVAGQIGYHITGGIPCLYVCDGTYTAGIQLSATVGLPWHGKELGVHSNGELLANDMSGSTYWHVQLYYGGTWRRTSAAWIDVSASFTGGEPGAIKVVRYDYTGIGMPVLLLTDPSYRKWACITGWYLV